MVRTTLTQAIAVPIVPDDNYPSFEIISKIFELCYVQEITWSVQLTVNFAYTCSCFEYSSCPFTVSSTAAVVAPASTPCNVTVVNTVTSIFSYLVPSMGDQAKLHIVSSVFVMNESTENLSVDSAFP